MKQADPRDVSAKDLLREVEAVLVRRVEDVQRENERLRKRSTMALLGGAVALGVAVITLVMSAGLGISGRVADSLDARRIVLRDDAGLVRAILDVNQNGAARLAMQDREGRERLKLTLLADGSPGLTFSDRNGRSRTVLGLLPDETSNLVFADANGSTRAVIGLGAEQSPSLVFADGEGASRVGLYVDTQGEPSFTLFESDTGPRADPLAEDLAGDAGTGQ